MSTPDQMQLATSPAINLSHLTGQLFAGLCELTRLNLETFRSVYSGAALHWENILRAQTPEQFITRQADALPWLALQVAGYTRGWMDVASEATTRLGLSACDRHDEHAHPVSTLLDGMTECAKGVDAMMRAVNPLQTGRIARRATRTAVDCGRVA